MDRICIYDTETTNSTIWGSIIEVGAVVYYTGSGKLADLLQKAIFNKTKIDAKLSTFGGTSDGRFIAKYCPVIEFGLVGRTMHQVDEKIIIDEFFLLTEIYLEFIDNYFNL